MHTPQMTLYVRLRKDGEKDRFGNETYGYSEPIAVEGVCLLLQLRKIYQLPARKA